MTELTLIFAILFALLLGAVAGGALAVLSLRSAGLKLVPQMYEEPEYTDKNGYLLCEDAERFPIDEELVEQIIKEIKEKQNNEH